MRAIQKVFARLRRDEDGASLVEYGLLVGLIAVASIAAINTLGGRISGFFTQIVQTLPAAGG